MPEPAPRNLADLAGREFVLMEESAPYCIALQNELTRQGVALDVFLRTQSATLARRLVEHGGVLSYLPRYTVAAAVSAGRLAELEIPVPNSTQQAQFVLHHGKALTPLIEGFLREASEALDRALKK